MKDRIRIVLSVVFMVAVLMGSGPCYDDDCSKPGKGWCSGETAFFCGGAGENAAYWLDGTDCAESGQTCVEGKADGYHGEDTPLSWCVDLTACDVVGQYECVTPAGATEPVVEQCVEVTSSRWWTANAIMEITEPAGIETILQAVEVPAQGDLVTEPLACVTCQSTCGCEDSTVCRDGLCIPTSVVGETDDGLVCCEGPRAGECLKGTPCEELDGTTATCDTSARCDECETDGDCETDDLSCLSTYEGQPSICIEPSQVDDIDYECSSPANEAWAVDACGNEVAPAGDVIVSYACRDDLDEIWGLDACDEWVELTTDCGEGYRCKDAQCILRVPDIEVSPTLLQYGDVAVGSAKTLTLDVGNLGDGTLTVESVAITTTSPEAFGLSQTSFEVVESAIVSVDVTFTPASAGSVSAKVVITSDDPDEGEVTVLVNATGV